MKDKFLTLMLITNKLTTPLQKYLDFIAICAEAGITSVQLREKNMTATELFEFGKQLQYVLKPFAIPLIINDHVDLCLALNADGVHLGQSDGDVLAARKRLGSHKMIGLTVDTVAQLHIANHLPIDYIGVGAIFPTKNKANINIWGLDGLKQAINTSTHPVVGIGGIVENNTSAVIQTGATGIAAIGVFHDAKNPKITTQNLRKLIRSIEHA
ncbi:MAG: thiamine phosphate synthase [Gammaproteobacteria bacterium]